MSTAPPDRAIEVELRSYDMTAGNRDFARVLRGLAAEIESEDITLLNIALHSDPDDESGWIAVVTIEDTRS